MFQYYEHYGLVVKQEVCPKETFEISVPPGISGVSVKIGLSYLPGPGNVYPIHSVVKKLEFDQEH